MGAPVRHVSDQERRHRLVHRHGLAEGFTDVATATTALTAWHATEAATVHLALWARVPGLEVADVESALVEERSLVKQLAMRRTLFAFDRALLPAVWGSAAARVAEQQRRQVERDVERAGLATDGADWVETAVDAVVAHLDEHDAATAAQIREAVPALDGKITIGRPDSKWGGQVNIAPRLLTCAGAEGRIVRATNVGHWRLNKPTWTTTEKWLGAPAAPLPEAEGYAELVRCWLRGFGPGTEADLVWWLGATKGAVRRALADVGAVAVSLDDDREGWLLAEDLEPEPASQPIAALLPTLDPTVMGWKERSFYLDPADVPYLFDTNGNAGTTAWWDGRVVGCWVQDDAGVVHVVERGPLDAVAREALDVEAARLTAWLDGLRIGNVYASPQMKQARLP